ncbi:MAG: hypothetical protein A2133_06045 [Actinobacteria bacterium RBG_16_64_13]|nr:MAG: hypothetical protein A2133_06045 [Actinobacteria bacterium RBG_16_64_13]
MPSSARGFSSIVCDKVAGKMILFGGAGEVGFDTQTWAYDPVANTWKDLRPANPPPGRVGHSMANDEGAGAAILFGGIQLSDSGIDLFDDTWAYDSVSNTWTNLNPAGKAPLPRDGHGMVYDPASRKVILFGGIPLFMYLNDTWSFGH